MEKKVKIEIELSKDIYDLIKEFCGWSGFKFEDFVEFSIMHNLEVTMDFIGEIPTKKRREFLDRIAYIRGNL
ncbi:MAG TPA: hypothetical protein EYP30_05360 [Archaeoglobaceae archaeon]|nr:hypothetical protein [Archaeoglobaceae archaeon]